MCGKGFRGLGPQLTERFSSNSCYSSDLFWFLASLAQLSPSHKGTADGDLLSVSFSRLPPSGP